MKIASLSGIARPFIFSIAVAAIFFARSASATPVSSLGVNFDLHFSTDQSSVDADYAAFVTPTSSPGNQPTDTSDSSGSFDFFGTLFSAGNSSANSSNFSNFTAYKAELNSAWTYQINSNTSPTNFTMNVDASALGAFGSTPAHITNGIQGATFSSSQPTITWTGPAGFNSILVIIHNLTDFSQDQQSLAATATSFTPSTPLGNGNYVFTLEYFKNITGTIIASDPTNGPNSLSNWTGATAAETLSDTVTFTIAVPEPTSTALLAIGGLIALRRKRR